MATIVVTTNPTMIGIKFLLANSIGLTPQIAAAAITDPVSYTHLTLPTTEE